MNEPDAPSPDPADDVRPDPELADPDPYLDENGELPPEEVWHRQHNEALIETWKSAGWMALLPAGLVFMVLGHFLGDWLWVIAPPLLIIAYYAFPVLTPLVTRLRSDRPMRAPTGKVLTTQERRRKLGLAIGLALALAAYFVLGPMVWEWVRATLTGWRI